MSTASECQDVSLECVDCETVFVWTTDEQAGSQTGSSTNRDVAARAGDCGRKYGNEAPRSGNTGGDQWDIWRG